MHFEIAFVALFAVATAVALVARRLAVPYTVALVVAGLVLGAVRAFQPPHLTKELLYAVFLPGLLFEAAFHLEFERFWQNKIGILALAVPGVVASIALTAFTLAPATNALHFVQDFRLAHGLVFAALIAATDPIAVVALFKSIGAPRRLAVLVEGESLLNDGTAVVLFTLILGVVTGGQLSAATAATDFVRVVGMGALIGTAIAFAAATVTQRVDDPMIEITLTTIAGYGSFVIAEHFHDSGVIATVTAGMICGNYAARTGMSPSTRIAVASFWEYVAFALNSIVFLLIGFEVRVEALIASWRPILVAWLVVTLARAAVIYGVSALLRRTRERMPWSWSAVMTWGGLRGGLSMVLVLGLPGDLPHRELLVTMTFGVVIVSILVQGLTMAPLLRALGLTRSHAERDAYEVQRGALRAVSAALADIEALTRSGIAPPDVTAELEAEYRKAAAAAEAKIAELHMHGAELRAATEHAARRRLLTVEKDALLSAHQHGLIGRHALEELMKDLDARLFELETGDEEHAAPKPKATEKKRDEP